MCLLFWGWFVVLRCDFLCGCLCYLWFWFCLCCGCGFCFLLLSFVVFCCFFITFYCFILDVATLILFLSPSKLSISTPCCLSSYLTVYLSVYLPAYHGAFVSLHHYLATISFPVTGSPVGSGIKRNSKVL